MGAGVSAADDSATGWADGGSVASVHLNPVHNISKQPQERIDLVAGIGVQGDAHAGATVQHQSRQARNASDANLRQVHLIHSELHEELRQSGFEVQAGQMGENVTTSDIDLLGLPTGTLLKLGSSAVVEVTGLRNPCPQLDGIQKGLRMAVLDRDAEGNLVRKAGVMGIVVTSGEVAAGDSIGVRLPALPHCALEPV